MKLFARRKENMDNDRVARQIAGRIIGGQKRLANYLNRRTMHLSGRLWLYLLIIFSLLFGGYCLYLVIHAVN